MLTLLTPAQMLSWADSIAEHYDAAASGIDAGAVRAALFQQRIAAAGVTNLDSDTPYRMYSSVSKLVASGTGAAYFGGQYRQVFRDWITALAKTGVQADASIFDLDTFATHYNGVTPYSCLFPWEFALIYYWANSLQLSPGNVYAPGGPVNAGYTYTTAGGIVVTQSTGFQLAHGGISAGVSTYAADNGGVVPSANVLAPYQQGYSPVIPELVVGTPFTGAGTATLTFSGTNQAGVAKTWTVNVVTGGAGLAGGAVVTLTPQTGGDRMRSVLSVATGGTVTAGTWTLRVQQEAGRPA